MTIGAGYSLAQLSDALKFIVSEQPKERTKTFRALLKHLRTLAGAQIRNMAVRSLLSHTISHSYGQSYSPIQFSKYWAEEKFQVSVVSAC